MYTFTAPRFEAGICLYAPRTAFTVSPFYRTPIRLSWRMSLSCNPDCSQSQHSSSTCSNTTPRARLQVNCAVDVKSRRLFLVSAQPALQIVSIRIVTFLFPAGFFEFTAQPVSCTQVLEGLGPRPVPSRQLGATNACMRSCNRRDRACPCCRR